MCRTGLKLPGKNFGQRESLACGQMVRVKGGAVAWLWAGLEFGPLQYVLILFSYVPALNESP